METTTNPQPLGYGPAPPFHRRQRWRRGALLVVVVIAAAAAWRWGPWVRPRQRLLECQRQCLAYTTAPDQVVFEGEFAAAGRFLAQGSGWRPLPVVGALADNRVDFAAASDPPCWPRFLAVAGLPAASPTAGATVFLHERRRPDGRPVLVHVAFATDCYGNAQFLANRDLVPKLYDPAGPFRMPKALSSAPSPPVSHLPNDSYLHGPDVRVFAGQPDPVIPAHFTIRYQMWGQEDVVDGHVENDGGISMLPRNRPLPPDGTRPPWDLSGGGLFR